MLLLSCPVQWCGSYPTHPTALPVSTAVMSCAVPLPGVWCVGGECVSVLFVWWGILCSPSPSQWWWVGPLWMVGCRCGGGWHGEGRAVVLLTPRRMAASPSRVWCPPPVRVVVLLNGGVWWVVCCPVFGLGSPLRIVPVPLCHLHFPSVCVLPCLLWVGKCGGVWWWDCVLLCSPPFVFAVTALLV